MNLCRVIVVICLATLGSLSARATTLTFEELNPAPALYDVMPTPYNGFTFGGWFFGPDSVYTPASGTIDLFTDYADPANPGDLIVTNSNNQITSPTPFYFDGAWFSGYSGATFELWLGGALVHTSDTLADAPGSDPYQPTFLSSGYSGQIDKIIVSAVQGYYAMDDFTFRRDVVSIPEPQTYALVLLAIGICGIARRRVE